MCRATARFVLPAVVTALIPFTAATGEATSAPGEAVPVVAWERLGASSGRPLIFLPALGFPGSSWSKVYQAFERTNPIYVVTFAGAPGMGRCQSSCLDRAVAELHALIERERLDRPVLIGHLMGGHVALRLAGEFPESVHGVFCIPSLRSRVRPDQRAAAGKRMAERYLTESPEMWESLLRMEATRAVSDPKLADDIMESLRKCDRETYSQLMGELVADQIEDWLPKVRVPVLLMVPVTMPRESPDPSERTLKPSQYAKICVDRMRLMYPGLSQCDATSLRYARTFPIYEHAPQVVAALERYLRRVDDPATKWGSTASGPNPATSAQPKAPPP